MAGTIRFDEPEFQLFYDYWHELRGDSAAPLKADFDPLNVPSLMAQMSVIQWFPPDMLLLRLMGTKIVEETGVETTGTNLLDGVYEPQCDLVKTFSQALFDHVAVGLVRTHRCFASGQTVEGRFASFPFHGSDGKTDIAVGVHKADADAALQIAPDDKFLYIKILSYEFVDVGNGAPDLSFSAGPD